MKNEIRSFAVVLVLWASTTCNAQTFTTIKSFGMLTNLTGLNPESQLIQGPDGTLYGTTFAGEGVVGGTVFKMQPDGSDFAVIKWFTNSLNIANHHAGPHAVLTLSGNTLYGTTSYGGSSGDGTVFKINTDGTGYSVLKNFTNSPDGANPYAGLTLSGGTLYGTTSGGGSSGGGTVFEINTDGTSYTVLKNFTNSDGVSPNAGLTLSGGTLYGTTSYGGSSDNGTVFKINTDGTGYTVLKSFTNSPDGVNPFAGLTLSGSTLYGTTIEGGSLGHGTVFKINTDGTGYIVLENFTNSPDGANPYAGLTLSGSTLYGTTMGGGSSHNGTAFKVNTDGTGYTVLKNFTYSDGVTPDAGLTLAGSTLYGTTTYGGSSGGGTVFKINTDGTGYTVLKNFATSRDGKNPSAGLTLSGGALYGTTAVGGSSDNGTVFKINTDSTGYTVLKNFTNSPDGANPGAELMLSGSTLYGTTFGGGSSGGGTVFKINTDGTGYIVLKNFTGSDGVGPSAGLTLSGGTLYGATSGGGSSGDGTVFKINTDGTGYTVLKNFTDSPDGAYPEADLMLSGSTLCGTTSGGGSSGDGTVFKINTDGTGYTVLKNFTNSPDGANPYAGLTLSGGTLYGTTSGGGDLGEGTVFSITLNSVTRPQLSITRASATVILTWPTNATGFTLQYTTNLDSPALWNAVSSAPVIVNNQNTVTNPIFGVQMFFRLSQ